MSESENRPEAETETESEPTVAEPAAAEGEAAAVTASADAEGTETAAPATEEPVAPAAAAVAAPAKRERTARPAKPAPPAPKPLGPYAIIETGGKQYRVSVGDRVSVEKLTAEAGSEIVLDRVLLLGGNGATRVGTPTVAGAAVTATVDEHYRGEKIVVFKYKPKKRYRRRMGHRQSLTRLTITAISG